MERLTLGPKIKQPTNGSAAILAAKASPISLPFAARKRVTLTILWGLVTGGAVLTFNEVLIKEITRDTKNV